METALGYCSSNCFGGTAHGDSFGALFMDTALVTGSLRLSWGPYTVHMEITGEKDLLLEIGVGPCL